jgi:hypothetical protein
MVDIRKLYNHLFTATGVAVNRGADFVKHLVPSRRARQNKALDPTAAIMLLIKQNQTGTKK